MKIKKIDLFELHLPYSGGEYELSGGWVYNGFDSVIVRLTADDGTEGWGESTPFGPNYIAAHARGARARVEEIAPHMIGRYPRDMVTVETGSFNAPIENGGVLPPKKSGLGVTMNLELLGAPVASWEEY